MNNTQIELYNTAQIDALLNAKKEKQLLHTLTDELWQEYFQLLKQRNIPSPDKKLKRNVNILIMNQMYWNLSGGDIKTLDEYYVSQINDTLSIIRGKHKSEGVIGTVYRIGHIKELLRFEPELHSKFINDDGFTYFEVWLEK